MSKLTGEHFLALRDLVSCVIQDLFFVTANIEERQIIIHLLDKEIMLSASKLAKLVGPEDFINYIKEKINE